MRVTPASAHATACANENNSVKLQWIPWFVSSSWAAWIPSQVDANLMSTRSFDIPWSAEADLDQDDGTLLFVQLNDADSLGDGLFLVE
jgi:hypothetical protein